MRPYLERLGYTGSRLASYYQFDRITVPLAGFYGKPWDTRSACLAVIEAKGGGKAAAAECMGLGAPTVLVCREDILEWWGLSVEGPGEMRSIPRGKLSAFFDQHGSELSPESIYAAKLRRPVDRDRQMWFVDVGLMPATERRIGETLHRLVEGAIQGLSIRLGGQLRSKKNFADLYKTVFWLLAAKLLHDKGVDNFKKIALTDVDEVFRRVGRHYADVEDLPPGGKIWRPAIDEAATRIAQWGYLGNVSSESLGYLYETALVDAKPRGKAAQARGAGHDIRKELGIHSTPTVLIDHMLSQLWPLVEGHKPQDRYVFEPACGHGGFLVAAMRWLRDFSGMKEGPAVHRYLRDHLHGVEIDSFASELARLSLTLADVPYGNSWRIENRDMFDPGVLAKGASQCTLLLANPPYEAFHSSQRSAYRKGGSPVTALTKAVEMLQRTLRSLPPGGVFGIVMPQGVLHDKESEPVREFLVHECEITEISLFADSLFEKGDHEVAVLMGQRRKPTALSTLMYRRVRERGMNLFKERLAFSSQREALQSNFAARDPLSLLLPDLPEVWEYLGSYPSLDRAVHVQKGFEWISEESLKGREVVSKSQRTGWMKAVVRADDDYGIWALPRIVWIDPKPGSFRRLGAAAEINTPQVILNYARIARDPWRLKAVIDEIGVAVSSRFVAFRPKPEGPSLHTLWALLNSPVANAYAYCFSGKRETLVKEWRKLPLPIVTPEHERAIAAAAERYLAVVKEEDNAFMRPRDEAGIRRALMAMDAEVLRLYDLPPRLERQLLDLFKDVERKGVGCEFRGYYPPNLDTFVPLHELISDEYARSTLGRFRKQHQPLESGDVLDAMRRAAEAFAEE